MSEFQWTVATKGSHEDFGPYATPFNVSTVPPEPITQTPTLSLGTVQATSVGLSWTAAANATQYEIYRNGSLLTTVSGTSHTDNTVSQNTSYNYYVRGINSEYTGPDSNTVNTTTPYATLTQAPTLSLGTVTASSVALSWTSVTNATEYEVRRDNVLVQTTASTSWTDNSVSEASSYDYDVRAINPDSNGPYSNVVTANTPYPNITAAPTLSAGTITSSSVGMSWTSVANAVEYEVYRNGSLHTTVSGTSYTDNSVNQNTSYNYHVRGINPDSNGPNSNTINITTPYAPITQAPTLSLGTVQHDSVALSWTPADNATQYEIRRNGSLVNTTGSLSWTDETVAPESSYDYDVRGINPDSNGPYSNTVNANTPAPEVTAAPTVSVTGTTEDSVSLSWTSVTNAAEYEVRRGGVLIATQAGTTLLDQPLSSGTTYEYAVRGINAASDGPDGFATAHTLSVGVFAASDAVSVGWNGSSAIPENLTVTQQAFSLLVEWDSDGTEFVVQRERWVGAGSPND